MSITGITTTDDNGVKRITNSQQSNNCIIDGETVILDSSSSQLKATGSVGVTIKNSHIKIKANTPNGSDDSSVFTYGARQNSTSKLRVLDNSTILAEPLQNRKNIHISELSNSNIIESQNTRNMFCYSQSGCIIQNAVFRGINVWEIFGAPSIASGITMDGTNFGYLNWETSRLDFLGFAVKNIQKAHAWLGAGNGGNNEVWHWDNDSSFDNTKLKLQDFNNKYREGYTVCWQFKDRDSSQNTPNVKVIIKDDYPSSMQEVARFVTDSEGKLTGSYDTQKRTSSSDTQRPVVFVVSKYSNTSGSGISGTDGGQSYDLVAVTTMVEVRSYLHQEVSGFKHGDTFNIQSAIGSVNPDYSANSFFDFVLIPDASLTEKNIQTVKGYSVIDTSSKLYDRYKAYWYDVDGVNYISKSDSLVDLGNLNVTIDSSATQPFSVTGDTVTIKTTTFNGSIKTTGVVTLLNGSVVSGSIQDSNGDSSITVTTPSGFSQISVHNTSQDADDGVNSLATGNTFRYVAATKGGDDVWYRLVKSDNSEIVVKHTLHTEVGIYSTDLVVTAENAALGTLVEDSQFIKEQLAEIKIQSIIAANNTQPE